VKIDLGAVLFNMEDIEVQKTFDYNRRTTNQHSRFRFARKFVKFYHVVDRV